MQSFFLKKGYLEKCIERNEEDKVIGRTNRNGQGAIIWYNLKITNLCRLHLKEL